MRVHFLIGGAQKGGTTALHHFLRGHPALCFAQPKEVHYFHNDARYAQPGSEQWYHQHFSCGPGQLAGEATPIYLYWKSAAARIHAYNPQMKLIFLLRDPVARAYSHYQMEKARGKERLPFWLAIRLEPLRLRLSRSGQHPVYSYLDRGRYAPQIRRMLDYFPREQLLFIKNATLRTRHKATLRRVCDFLGVAPRYQRKSKSIFSHKYPPLSPMMRVQVIRALYEDIEAVEELLQWDCSEWKRV